MDSIATHYNGLLQDDHLLTQPIAAIQSLIALLSASPQATISETLSLIDSATRILKASVVNPIPLSAGTDLFQRYITSTLQIQATTGANGRGQKASPSGGAEDFETVRAHLIDNSRLLVQRAIETRHKIATVARKFIRDDSVVLTCGRSRVVAAVLNAAADAETPFRVIYVDDAHAHRDTSFSSDVVRNLRKREIPVAMVSFAALATALRTATFALVGAESILENGGAISAMGTYQMGLLMRSVGKPMYVVAESHKFVRMYPLRGEDLPVGQGKLDFRTGGLDDGNEGKTKHEEGRRKDLEVAADFTPPELITAIVTEAGVQTPGAVSEDLIKIWY